MPPVNRNPYQDAEVPAYGAFRNEYAPPSYAALARGDGGGKPFGTGELTNGWDKAVRDQNRGSTVNYAKHEGHTFFEIDDGRDPADRLPAAAKAKLLRLREEHSRARDQVEPMHERVHEARVEATKAWQMLQRVEAEFKHAGYAREDAIGVERSAGHVSFLQRIEQARTKLSRAEEIRDRLEANANARSESARGLGALLDNNVERWLKGLRPAATITAVETVAPKLKKGETFEAAVERIRQERATLLADLRDLRARPITTAMAKELARAQIDMLAENGRPSVHALLDHGEQFRTKSVNAASYDNAVKVSTFDALAFTAWLMKPQLITAINAEIDAHDTGVGISDEDRADREAELLGTLHSLEYEEEAAIEQAEMNGSTIMRRPDALAPAVLDVVVNE